jgi:hypothetical protein
MQRSKLCPIILAKCRSKSTACAYEEEGNKKRMQRTYEEEDNQRKQNSRQTPQLQFFPSQYPAAVTWIGM